LISFSPTPEEVEITNIAKQIASTIREKAREAEQDPKVLDGIISEVKEIGFLQMEEPERCGGMEMPMLSQVQVYAALAYGDLGAVQSFPGLNDGASLLRVLGDDAKEDFVQSVQQNGTTIAFIDNSAHNHGELKLKKNSNAYTLAGSSNPVRLGNIATHVVVATYSDDEELVLLWANKETNNWNTKRGTYYVGLEEAHLARLSFDSQTIANTQVIATGEEAERIVNEANLRIYLLQAAKQLGIMQASVDYATEHTAQRKAFGQVIAQFQGVSFRVSQMVIETNATRNLLLQAASAVDEGSKEAEALTLTAINRAHKGVKFVTDSAVQLLGGHGFVQDYPVEKWMRDAQAQVLLYGKEHRFLLERGEQIISSLKTEVQV